MGPQLSAAGPRRPRPSPSPRPVRGPSRREPGSPPPRAAACAPGPTPPPPPLASRLPCSRHRLARLSLCFLIFKMNIILFSIWSCYADGSKPCKRRSSPHGGARQMVAVKTSSAPAPAPGRSSSRRPRAPHLRTQACMPSSRDRLRSSRASPSASDPSADTSLRKNSSI